MGIVTKWSFVERTDEEDYLAFQYGYKSRCWGDVMGNAGGPQNITISFYCSFGEVLQAIMRSIGINLEQVREDRDNYVLVEYPYGNCTDPSEIYDISPIYNLGTYDFNSILHSSIDYWRVN